MTQELKPCPFCGSIKLHSTTVPNTGGNTKFMWCQGCSAQGPWFKSKEDPSAAWSQRPSTKPTVPTVEELLPIYAQAYHDSQPPLGDPKNIGRIAGISAVREAMLKANALTVQQLDAEITAERGFHAECERQFQAKVEELGEEISRRLIAESERDSLADWKKQAMAQQASSQLTEAVTRLTAHCRLLMSPVDANGKLAMLIKEVEARMGESYPSPPASAAVVEKLVAALEELSREAVVLSEEYLSAFKDWNPQACIQGWDKARWIRALAAYKKAKSSLAAYRQSQPATGWMPISEAKEHVTYLTLHEKDLYPVSAFRTGGTWLLQREGPEDNDDPPRGAYEPLLRKPTWFMPLPQPPATGGEVKP